MRYSFMSFSCPDFTMDQVMQAAKLYKYEGFEPRVGSGHRHGIELDSPTSLLREARSKAEENGITLCCLATSCSFADPEKAAENMELGKRILNLAAEVHCPTVRVFGGKIPEGVSREESACSIINSLKKLADDAQEVNVTLCLETHDSWCDPEDVAGIAKSVNHSSVAVNWDMMHPVLREGYSVEKSFEILKPWIKHVHVHDGNLIEGVLKFLPMGTGVVDHKTAIRLLEKNGYRGFISGEWINWEPCETHLPREIEVMKSYEE